MSIALREIWRSKLKFGLLAGAIGLLVFLLLFLGTLSNTLLSSYIGAVENAEADIIVFSEDARRNLQASRLEPATADRVAALPGVSDAAGISEATLTVEIAGERTDLSLWGTEPGRPGDVPVVEGRAALLGEVVMDISAKDIGFTTGSTIKLVETGHTLDVVGFTTSRQYSVLPTGYTPAVEWNRIFFATYPGAPVAPVSVIAADVDAGADPVAVSAGISRFLAASDAATPAEAAASAPGVSSIQTSFNLIVGITFAIVILVIGFFFMILTVQKQRSFALLRAVGASKRSLGGSIIAQIVVTMSIGIGAAVALLLGASAASGPSFPLTVDLPGIAATSGVVLVMAALAGGFAIRRAFRIDPIAAAQGVS